jgi:4-hydroxy-tetrahydrodipicolinate synthase
MIAGRVSEARTLQMRLTEFFDCVVGSDFPEGVRAAVELRGFKLGISRQPVDEDNRPDRSELARAMQRLRSNGPRD